MQSIARVLAPLALVGTILPPFLYLFKMMGDGPMKLIMLLATVVWFVFAPFWMKGGNE